MFKKLARTLFRLASITNTVGHLTSGKPDKVVKHIIRKRIYSKLGKLTK